MKLKKLLKDLPIIEIKGSKEIEITGLCSNSKLVAPGNLFIAKKGRAEDGAHYIPEAIEAGAIAIITDIYDPFLKNVAQLIHPNPAAIEGELASYYYQNAHHNLFMVGITGTNGKTTTSFLVKHLLDALKGPCGLIGTIEYIIGSHHYQATRTTPDVISNHKMLREMVLHGSKSAVMEVTSHALDQNRIQNIKYDAAVFTNLTLDHLDYHLSMEKYADAKKKLFSPEALNKSASAIVNVDCPWHLQMINEFQGRVIRYGIQKKEDLHINNIRLTPEGSFFNLEYLNKNISAFCPLIGKFNLYNYMAAAAIGIILDAPLDQIVDILAKAPAVPGRLENISNGLGIKIYVDFAHTDDALAKALQCLRELKTKRLITVFGCGGDRDRGKRPKMAAVSEHFSDYTIVTSDNPRMEDPEAIANEIVPGFSKENSYCVELDRRQAIHKAIEISSPDDIILIAGKGHETYQIFAHKTIEFDDRKVALHCCEEKQSLYHPH